MEKMNDIQSIHPSLRDLYNRAVDSERKGNVDYAVQMLKEVVKKVPSLVPAREKLRECEYAKTEKLGFGARMSAWCSGKKASGKIKGLISKKPLEAMAMIEDELAKNLNNKTMLNLMVKAALAADARFIAIDAMEVLTAFDPDNETELRRLADLYKEDGQGVKVLQIIQRIANKRPNDGALQSELRAAAALASMQKGDWNKEGSTQEKSKGDVAQQLEEGSIRSTDQAKVLIAKYRKDLEANDSVDTRRRLAEALHVVGDFDAEIAELETIAAKIGSLDPTLDKSIENAVLSKIDLILADLEANPADYDNPEEQIAEYSKQRFDYQMERALDRVKKYPNDTQLHYDLALLYFSIDEYDKAIEEFQYARKGPKLRLSCMVYLGRCFFQLKRFDMAIEQLEGAIKDMLRMDHDKLEAIYYLANVYDAMGQEEKALDGYKDIYQNEASFKDVKQRIDAYYERHKEK